MIFDDRVVLLHPIAQDDRCWAWMDVGEARTPVLPGHGGRPPVETMAQLADGVAADLAPRAHVVGVAFGALVALHVALRHPDRVGSAMIVAGCAHVEPAVALARAVAVADGVEPVVGETLARWFGEDADAAAQGRCGREAAISYARSALRTVDPASYAATWRAIAGHDVRDAVGGLDLPVTVVSASRDASSPPSAGRALHEAIAGSRFELVDGPHMIHLEQPQALEQAMVRHLDWVRGDAA